MEREVVPDQPARSPARAASRIASSSASSRPTSPRELAARAAGREIVERGAHAVDVEHVLLAEAAHARAAERLGLDQPQQREVAQRLAYGRLARAELLRDARLDERRARARARRG